MKALQVSDALHLAPTGVPYTRENAIAISVGGTLEKPLVIDGHGATLTGFRRYGAEAWKDEGAGVFSMPFINNTYMKAHWEGFELVFFDGKPGKSCVSRAALEPFGYVLFTCRSEARKSADVPPDVLYVCLPAGKNPDTVRIESAGLHDGSHGGNLGIVASHIVVRNLVSTWARGDGFSSAFAVGLVFENVESAYNMDQGMSHHSSHVVVRNSWFHHNAGCGIVDIRMNDKTTAKSLYQKCLIENDSFRGGVEFFDGDYEMQDCIVRGNSRSTLLLARGGIGTTGAKRFRNCLFSGREGERANQIEIRPDCSAVFENCTFSGLPLGVRFDKLDSVQENALRRCAFIRCENSLWIRNLSAEVRFDSEANYFDPGIITVNDHVYPKPDGAKYVAATGRDRTSRFQLFDGPVPPYAVRVAGGDGSPAAQFGATFAADWTVGANSTPVGVVAHGR